MNNEERIKYLEMTEKVIERMGNNSFQLKGWSVTLVAAISAISMQGSDKRFILLSVLPVISFWFLDAYYLKIERQYQVLYKMICLNNRDIDFRLDISDVLSAIQHNKKLHYVNCLLSKTEVLFYGSIAFAIIAFSIVVLLLFDAPIIATG